jgi:hypothetical protein
VFDPVAKIVYVLHLIAGLQSQFGNRLLSAITSAEGVDRTQVDVAEAITFAAPHPLPKTAQMITSVVFKGAAQKAIKIRHRLFALNFHAAPYARAVPENRFKAVDLTVLTRLAAACR